MFYEVIHMKEQFPILGKNGKDPLLTVSMQKQLIREDLRKIRPCVLICPGGGYGFISDREEEVIAMHFLAEGYAVFMLSYSVEPHLFPAQLREVAAAMELIHSNAEKWMCDPNRIAIAGFSAGGHLAAHYSNAYDIPEVREIFPESKPAQAAILSYPVITADSAHCHANSFRRLLGHEYPLSREELDKFSCDRLVSRRTPPTFLWHTVADELVPVQNSLLYAQALASCGVPFELHIYPAGFHGLSTVDDVTNSGLDEKMVRAKAWLQNMKDWLKHTL